MPETLAPPLPPLTRAAEALESVSQAARRLDRGRTAVRGMVLRGELRGCIVGGLLYIASASVDDCLARRAR
jgi:hypothetical protein